MFKLTALTVLVICYAITAYGASSPGLTSTFKSQTSFPLLPSSEVQSVPSYHSNSSPFISDSQLQVLSLSFFENAYMRFATSMGIVFSDTSSNLFAETVVMSENMTKIEQLYAIPTLIMYFVPMFDDMARDFNTNGLDLSKIAVRSMSLAPQDYIYCPTQILNDYIQSISNASKAATEVSNLLAELTDVVNGQLKKLQVSRMKKRIFLSISAAHTIEALNQAIVAGNQQLENALESIVVNGLPIRKYQTSVCAKNFLGLKFTFLNQVNAAFSQLIPVLNNFAAAFISDGKITKKNKFAVKISKINYQIRETTNGTSHYVRVLGDYCGLFSKSLTYIQQNQPYC